MAGQKYRALVLSGKMKVSVEMLDPLPLEAGWVRLKLGAGGICGSDLHYYKDYGNSGFPLKNPVVMGHEASGTVVEVAPDVTHLKPGDKVAINPVMNCGRCIACRRGEANLCPNKRFPGSAMNYPHINGYFRELIETEARCCTKVPDDTDLALLAFIEPLSCSLHAVEKAGTLVGRNVLVTGSGPIGTLAAAAAKASGAAQVTITDVADEPLEIARRMGADTAINTLKTSLEDTLAPFGPLDVAIDASGAIPAIGTCIKLVRKGGTMVQLGIPPAGDQPIPYVNLINKEVKFFGTNQFTTEFETAMKLVLTGRINPKPMLTKQFAFEQAEEAFALAADRKKCMKVQFIP